MDAQKLILRSKSRGECYKFLALCFHLPRKELFFSESMPYNLTRALKHVCPDAAEYSTRMGQALSQYSDEELSVEYAKLFVGPFELKAPPYGSVYIDDGRRVMGDSTLKILKTYQQSGLTIRDEFKELPDHIYVELEFMYYLIFKELEFLEKSQFESANDIIKRQGIFLNEFLGQWIPLFRAKIIEGTGNEFYRALGDCVFSFVTNDMKYVTKLVEEYFSRSSSGA